MYSTIPTIAMTSETFHLVKNGIDIGRLRLFLGLGVFLIPTLFANAIFVSIFHLEGINLVISTSTVGLIFLNLVLFLLGKANRGNRTLIFGLSKLRVIENNGAVELIPLEELKITTLTYEMDEEKRFPAIRIRAKDFGCMTIGSNQFSKEWQPTKEQIDCTTYLIPSNEEWQRFLEIINHLK
jgi:hypothetical protein